MYLQIPRGGGETEFKHPPIRLSKIVHVRGMLINVKCFCESLTLSLPNRIEDCHPKLALMLAFPLRFDFCTSIRDLYLIEDEIQNFTFVF